MQFLLYLLMTIIVSTGTFFLLEDIQTKQGQFIGNSREDNSTGDSINIDDDTNSNDSRKNYQAAAGNPTNISLKTLEAEIIETVEEVKDSVVNIIISKDFVLYEGWQATGLIQEQVGGGSGFLVDNDYVLTNKHVISDTDSSYTILFADGEAVEAEKTRLDPTLDIAIIKIPDGASGKRSIARITDFSKKPVVGQFALAIGNALAEFQNSVTFGIVSGQNRQLTLDNNNLYAGLLQTDTSISEGNSGGPLFNLDDEVIGINTAVSAFGENIGFAIPITQQFVDATLNSVKNYDEIVRPFIGIRYLDLTRELAKELEIQYTSGIYIAEVVPGSPADQAGILAKEIVTKIDGVQISADQPFLYQLFTKLPNEVIEVSLASEGTNRNVSVQLERN